MVQRKHIRTASQAVNGFFSLRVCELEKKQTFLRGMGALLKNFAMYTYILYTCSVLQ